MKTMKKIKFLLAAMMAIVSVPRVWAVDGDTFTAQTEDGVTFEEVFCTW